MKHVISVVMLGMLCLFSLQAEARGKRADMAEAQNVPAVREGDIIFQSLRTTQSLAIQLATKSEYTHCGIVLFRNGQPYVFEAIQNVSWTPLHDWIRRGLGHHYVLMRMKNELTPDQLAAIKASARLYEGKNYDLRFQWSDESIYCSELIWKMYEKAGIRLVPLKTFRDYALDHEAVQKKIRERYGHDFSLEEQVVAPSDLMESDLLTVIR